MTADFEAFVRQESAGLLRTAFLLVGDRAGAEDVLQTALLRAYRSWDRIEDPNATVGYVRRIVARTAINWRHRFRKPHATSDEALDEELVGQDLRSAADEVVDRLTLWPHVRALPAKQRAVLVLRYYEDLTEADTAAALGCSIGTVKSHHARALKTLRRKVGDNSDQHSPLKGEGRDAGR